MRFRPFHLAPFSLLAAITALLFASSRAVADAPPEAAVSPVAVNAPINQKALAASEILPPLKNVPPGATEKEIKLGEKYAAEIAKNPKVKIVDPKKDEKTIALYAKLNAIAQRVGKASARPQIEYKVTIIDDVDVNAFTLPNGNLYFYTGLLDLLSSDDEIAAVMAHEIGHNARMHALRGDKKAKSLTWLGLAAVLAAMAGGQNGGNIAAFSQYALIGVMSGYSLEYEKEADAAGVTELIGAGYNPSAMATVMQRFEVEERRRPHIEAGIFQDHPEAGERVSAIEKQIRGAGLPFTPRAVSGGAQAVAAQDKDRVRVQYKDITLMEFADAGASTPPAVSPAFKRASQAAQILNDLLRDNLKMHEIQIGEVQVNDGNGARLLARGTEIARVLPADAKLQNLAPLACAQKWRDKMRLIFWRETVNGAL
jgi:predicted Zn-dependent protease